MFSNESMLKSWILKARKFLGSFARAELNISDECFILKEAYCKVTLRRGTTDD
jgi:hypothetical protein